MSKYRCPICLYVYDESKGIASKGIAPETKWEELPADFKCPMCKEPRASFKQVKEYGSKQKGYAVSGNTGRGA